MYPKLVSIEILLCYITLIIKKAFAWMIISVLRVVIFQDDYAFC